MRRRIRILATNITAVSLLVISACTMGLPDASEYSSGGSSAAPNPSSSSSSSTSSSSSSGSTSDSSITTIVGEDSGASGGDASTTPNDGGGADSNVGVDASPSLPNITTCGGNGLPGDQSTLFKRENNVVTIVEVCGKGCEWTKDHASDHCRSNSTCIAGEGLYCGNNGLSGDPGVLFRCGNGKIVPEARCVNGCDKKPAGEDDACK